MVQFLQLHSQSRINTRYKFSTFSTFTDYFIPPHLAINHHHHRRLLRQKAAHKIQKTEYTDSMNIAHILNQMLEDKSTQTTIRTYIKVTTHSPTHRQ